MCVLFSKAGETKLRMEKRDTSRSVEPFSESTVDHVHWIVFPVKEELFFFWSEQTTARKETSQLRRNASFPDDTLHRRLGLFLLLCNVG